MKDRKKQIKLVKRGKRLPVKAHVKAGHIGQYNFKVEIDGVTVGVAK